MGKRREGEPAGNSPVARPGRGRPVKPVGEARSTTVRVRFTPAERAALEAAAANRSLSDWCREVLLAAARDAQSG